MSHTIQAIVYEAIDQVAIRQLTLGLCGPDEIVCETLYTFVSPGTELRILAGDYGARDNFPLIPGYSVVGKVVEAGGAVKGFRVGDLVSGRNPKAVPGIKAQWGGQASAHVYATSGEDRPVLLPPGAKPLDYAIAEVAAISFRGVEAANPVPGETAVVIGQGLIGAFSAAWLQARGCRVLAADVDAGRLRKAQARGLAETVNMSDADAIERIQAFCNGGADIVVESSGSSAGALAAHQLIRRKPQSCGKEYKVDPIAFYHGDWPRLVMQANYLEKIPLDPFGFFPGEGVTLLAPKDRGVEDRQKTVECIRTGKIQSACFIDAVMPFTQAAEGYEKLKRRQLLSVAYQWKG